MTQCPTEEMLVDYAAGRVDANRAALIERHKLRCVRCADLCAAQTAIWQSLDEWKPEPVSAGFNRELWRRIDAAPQSCWRFGFWKRVTPLALAMAVIVTAIVLDHSRQHPDQLPTSAIAPAAVTVSDADQLDRTLDDIQLLHEVDVASQPAHPNSGIM